MRRRMVVLTEDGARHHGFSHDFVPGKEAFHFCEVDASGDVVDTPTFALVQVQAVFFVRDFGFDRERRYTEEQAPFEPSPPPTAGAKRLRVECAWGETLEGLTYGYDPERKGFFLFPTAPKDRTYNLERAYLTRRGVSEVELSPAA
ncbi:MAG: hypothetical protein R3199_10360 [Gemmatimonadota bacterium]|nr:hypothetical protein [Gemmatimonadota bacterium]